MGRGGSSWSLVHLRALGPFRLRSRTFLHYSDVDRPQDCQEEGTLVTNIDLRKDERMPQLMLPNFLSGLHSHSDWKLHFRHSNVGALRFDRSLRRCLIDSRPKGRWI